ncbi:hypothetical protein EHQ92_16260 [Leptospira biflexa]|nr:hypothetical protein EHQ92_16260 [Leptospira biflexa]TGM44233.1 hypothetical protein EHQ88_16595 [Leptospira biflexa]
MYSTKTKLGNKLMNAQTFKPKKLQKPKQILCVITFFLATTYNCATSLLPVKTSIEKKETIAVFVNLVEAKPALTYKATRSIASKNIAEFDEFFPMFKQLAQKELPAVKFLEPKTTPQEILGQTVYTYDFGKTGAKIGIEFIPATTYMLSNESEYTSEKLKKQSFEQTTKIVIRFREINGDRLGKYIGSRLGYELASVTINGSCDEECPKNINAMMALSNPGKHAPALKAQIHENLKKVIQEILASKED